MLFATLYRQISKVDVERCWYDDYAEKRFCASYSLSSCLLYGNSKEGAFTNSLPVRRF